MVNTIDNRRSKFTKKMIQQEFLTLLKEKDIARITVKELAEAANINRGTFYNYYTDPYDLFERMEADFLAQLLDLIHSEETTLTVPLEQLLIVLKENQDMTNLILGGRNESKLLANLLNNEIKESTLADFSRNYPNASEEELELYFIFFVEGAIAVIKQWLTNYNNLSAKKITEMLYLLSNQPTEE